MNTTLHGCGRLADIIDAIADPVRVISPEKRIILTNEAMERTFGNTLGVICYKAMGRSCGCDNCLCEPVFKLGRGAQGERECAGRRYSVNSRPFFDEDGKRLGAVEVFRDVTEYVAINEQLSRVNDGMIKDLNVARRLQHSMLVRPLPKAPGYDISAAFFPCGEVGGDVYDVIVPEPGKLLLYIADVAGHGVMSAMLTVFIKREMPAQCDRHGGDLPSALRGLFTSFSQFGAEDYIYFTLFAALLDVATGTLSCANMGHSVCPLLRAADGSVSELNVPGDPVCQWVSEPNIGFLSTRLEQGGRLLLYTDGVEDADTIIRFPRGAGECTRLFMNSRVKNDIDDQVILLCDRK